MRVMVWGYQRHYHTFPAGPMFVPPLAMAGVLVAAMVAIGVALSMFAVVLALLAGTAVVAGAFGLLAFGSWQLARLLAPWLFGRTGRRPHPALAGTRSRRRLAASPPDTVSPVDVLRRRYAAGEIGQAEFRRRLVDLLKERYVHGGLTLAEYESRVRHVYRDPALRPPGGP
jgi:hypothetical protein